MQDGIRNLINKLGFQPKQTHTIKPKESPLSNESQTLIVLKSDGVNTIYTQSESLGFQNSFCTANSIEEDEFANCLAMPVEEPSEFRGSAIDDNVLPEKWKRPKGSHLGKEIFRNTNLTGVYRQKGGTCYAHSSTSAYLNSVMRIKGIQNIPSFSDCFAIASAQGDHGGNPCISLQALEDRYHFGIQWERTEELPSIRDILMISVILCFSTTKEGYKSIANGSLTKKPSGIPSGRHSVLIEGYDFENDLCICKNSWGIDTASDRFKVNIGALHNCQFIRVFWTLRSIDPRLKQDFKIKPFKGQLKGKAIDSAWMSLDAAKYSSDYLAELDLDHSNFPFAYHGYKIDQWIRINLARKNLDAEKVIKVRKN